MDIIPKPKEILLRGGFFEFNGQAAIFSDIDGAADIIERFIDFADRRNTSAAKSINVFFAAEAGREAYILDISQNSIAISANTLNGVFYAVQTLLQLSGIAAGKPEKMQCCRIADEPRFKYRGFMLDEARHFFGKAFVKELLLMTALMKLNVFHWHLTDDQGWRIEIKKYPLLTEKGSVRNSTQLNLAGYERHREKREYCSYGKGLYYTQEDIKEIVAFAKELFIDVIPEVDMPGHLTAAAACYPELTCTKEQLEVAERWGVMKTVGCAGSPELYRFVFDVIDELSVVFPSKYFHIGGDEVPKDRWKNCPVCQKKIKELGLKNENELQGAFNAAVRAHLQEKGKTLIGWNEILRAGKPAADSIVQWWFGSCEKTGVKDWLRQGNSVIMTSCSFVYMDYFYGTHDLKRFYEMDYDTLGIPEEYSGGIIGAEAPIWTEYVRNKRKFDFNVYPRMQALAEICWTSEKLRDFDDFNSRLKKFGGIYEKFGIVPAPERWYLCKGLKGKKRKLFSALEWVRNPDAEFDRFSAEKKVTGGHG